MRRASGRAEAAAAAARLLLGIALAMAAGATADAGQQVLYAGGSFWAMGGVSAVNVAAWNGADWSALGVGVGSTEAGDTGGVATLLQLGSCIFAGGAFTVPTPALAKWCSGTAAWTAVGEGFEPGAIVFALTEFHGGLIAAGRFTSAGGVAAANIARWDGQWTALAAGFDGDVYALAALDRWLYAGGRFQKSGTWTLPGLARWQDEPHEWRWRQVGSINTDYYANPYPEAAIHALLPHDDEEIYLAGTLTGVDTVAMRYVGNMHALYLTFAALTEAEDDSLDGAAYALEVLPGGSLLVGGEFSEAGGATLNRIGLWNGSAWLPLGSGVEGPSSYVSSLAHAFDAIFVGGNFTTAGGLSARGLARWDGAQWSTVGDASRGALTPAVTKLLRGCTLGWTGAECDVCDRGSYGPTCAPCPIGTYADATGSEACTPCPADRTTASPGAFSKQQCVCSNGTVGVPGGPCVGTNDRRVVYVAGVFSSVDGVPAENVAKWNGTHWSAMPTFDFTPASYKSPAFLQHSQNLYMGWTSDGNYPYLFRWNGYTWEVVWCVFDPWLPQRPGGYVTSLASFDGGIVIGGHFSLPHGDVPLRSLIWWDGQESLSAKIMPFGGVAFVWGNVDILFVTEGVLYVAGQFAATAPGGVALQMVAAWDGHVWQSLHAGISFSGEITSMLQMPDGPLVLSVYFEGTGMVYHFNGAAWSSIAQVETNLGVLSLALWTDGSLLAYGILDWNGAQVYRWNGTTWHMLKSGGMALSGEMGRPCTMTVAFDALFACGQIYTADGEPEVVYSGYFSRWNGYDWARIGGAGTRPSGDDLWYDAPTAYFAGCEPGWAPPECTACERGSFFDGDDCRACPIGTFADEIGSNACTPCPEHTTTPSPGSSSSKACVCMDGTVGPIGGPCTRTAPLLYLSRRGCWGERRRAQANVSRLRTFVGCRMPLHSQSASALRGRPIHKALRRDSLLQQLRVRIAAAREPRWVYL